MPWPDPGTWMWAPREGAHCLGPTLPNLSYDYAAMMKRGRGPHAIQVLTRGATYGTALCGLELRAATDWVPINLDSVDRACMDCLDWARGVVPVTAEKRPRRRRR